MNLTLDLSVVSSRADRCTTVTGSDLAKLSQVPRPVPGVVVDVVVRPQRRRLHVTPGSFPDL